MSEETEAPRLSKKRLIGMLNSNWAVTVLGGLILALLTRLVTGFINLSLSTRSFETFGVSNEAGTPGAYLAPDSVYKLPLGERFAIDGGFLLSVNRQYGDPIVAITSDEGSNEVSRFRCSVPASGGSGRG